MKPYIVNTKDERIKKVFDVYETGGGGDCLFYCIAYSLYRDNSETKMMEVRNTICRYETPQFLELAREDEDMCKKGSWGTDVEILKAVEIYKVPIIVYVENRAGGPAHPIVCPSMNIIGSVSTDYPKVLPYISGDLDEAYYGIYCVYLPPRKSTKKPILLYNIGQFHYRLLEPKKLQETCPCVLTSKKSGEICGRKIVKDGRCGIHRITCVIPEKGKGAKKSPARTKVSLSRKCPCILLSGQRRGERCDAKVKESGKCGRHKNTCKMIIS